MTVINILSLGEEGIAVADEQASSQIRKYNIAQKLHPLNDKIIYGGSGSVDFVMDIYEISKQKLKESDKPNLVRKAYEIVNGVLISQKNYLKNRTLEANLGIGLEDFITGSLTKLGKPLGENIRNRAEQLVQQFDEMSGAQILIGGVESEKFDIYTINTYGTGIKVSQPHCSIGSGADESEKVLSTYVSLLPREKRDKIDRGEGLAKIIEATNASARLNVGVGGTISISQINKEGIKSFDENKCRLASEIVEALKLGFVNKDCSYDLLNKLIFNCEDFESVKEEFKSNIENWEKLDMILRGYKL